MRLEDGAAANSNNNNNNSSSNHNTTTNTNTTTNNTAWQKYLFSGGASTHSHPQGGDPPLGPSPSDSAQPLALLPLWGGYASVVWSCSVPQVNYPASN